MRQFQDLSLTQVEIHRQLCLVYGRVMSEQNGVSFGVANFPTVGECPASAAKWANSLIHDDLVEQVRQRILV